MLQMVADDENYDSIAAKLSPPTSEQVVKNEMHRTIKELNCSSRTGAVVVALRQGLID
jgi:DNA-binding NarL/FixJ family response regulator